MGNECFEKTGNIKENAKEFSISILEGMIPSLLKCGLKDVDIFMSEKSAHEFKESVDRNTTSKNSVTYKVFSGDKKGKPLFTINLPGISFNIRVV